MKKAFTALDEQGISYTFFDYKKQAITENEIKAWVDKLGIDLVLNKRGTTWRKQEDRVKAEADANLDSAITLMANNPSMIKRPILVNAEKNVLLAGFDETSYAALTA